VRYAFIARHREQHAAVKMCRVLAEHTAVRRRRDDRADDVARALEREASRRTGVGGQACCRPPRRARMTARVTGVETTWIA
jgi:hypothetical protein